MKAIGKKSQKENVLISIKETEFQLIDLFVDMCYFDIHNPALIFQFKVLALKMDYSLAQIDKLVEIGKSEYNNLFSEMDFKSAQTLSV